MPEPPVDITRVPNFGALREYLSGTPSREAVGKWVDKLEAWCTEIREELTKEEKQVKAQLDEIKRMDERLASYMDDKVALEFVEEGLADIERGVITFSEFMERRRRALV